MHGVLYKALLYQHVYQELDDEGVSVEVRVQGAIEVVQDRLKQLEKTTQTASTPGDVSQGKTLGLPLAISRQVSHIFSYHTYTQTHTHTHVHSFIHPFVGCIPNTRGRSDTD